MASALIPELVQPGNLYAPSNMNGFSVSGTWTNTDPKMVIDATARFRAYQPAISGVHYPVLPTDPFSVLFYGGPTYEGAVYSYNPRASMTLMHVATATAAISSNQPAYNSATMRWGLHIAPRNVGATTASPNNIVFFNMIGPTDRWGTFFNMGTTSPANRAYRYDGTNIPTLHDFALNTWGAVGGFSSGSIGSFSAISNPYFSIGAFPLTTGWGTPPITGSGLFNFGKIALFMDYYVTDAELLDLLDSMNNGPPSP